jgi:anti-sigma-K factor RskA
MTLRGTNGSTCRDVRQLLGVYVVGAIEPSERSVVDEHLGDCQHCRDELAGLAGLPAMLSRVPASDVERMSDVQVGLPEDVEPSAELLDSLLAKVGARRKSRLWRGAVAVAAAAVVAAGGAAAAVNLARPAVTASHTESASAVNAATGDGAVVDYSATPWGGTAMRVQVSGIQPGTTCRFFVVGKDGRAFAGSWTVQGSYGSEAWYPAGSDAAPSSVLSFQLTDMSGHNLVSIPVR